MGARHIIALESMVLVQVALGVLCLMVARPLVRVDSLAPPTSLTVGAQFPLFTTKWKEDGGGRRRLAAFLMAVNHINNKTDGFYDDLLPNTTIKVSVYDSRRDEGTAAVNAVRIFDDEADVAVGPASSGPTVSSQNIFKLKSISIPQVGYSATSPELSDNEIYPLFARTAPSDSYQARMIAATIKARGFRFVCVLSGNDAYSHAGAKEFAQVAGEKASGLKLLLQREFYSGVKSVVPELMALKEASCRIIVMWAKGADITTIAKAAERTGVTASNPEAPVLWFSSELFLSAFDNSCRNVSLCDKVFHGALLLTPSFGPGSGPSYEKLADAWHNQEPRVGRPYRTDVAGCDLTKDTKNRSIWIRPFSSSTHRCVAVNFSDYNREAARNYRVEAEGDGRISAYVPYAYDSAIAIAHGLHDLFTTSAYITAQTSKKSSVFNGESIFSAIANVSTFHGFSGEVSFQNQGDRDAGKLKFFVYNYDGVQFQPAGSIYQDTLTISTPLTLPMNFKTDRDFDDRPVCRRPQQYYFEMVSDCNPASMTIPLTITYDPKECKGDITNFRSNTECKFTPLSSQMGTGVLVVSVLGGILQVGWLIWLIRMHLLGSNTIKYSQFEFLLIFSFGLFLVAISPIQFIGPPTPTSCITRVWHLNLGITLVWAPMLVKIFRVHKLFNSQLLRRQTDLKVKRMLLLVGYLVLFEMVFLLIHSLVPGIQPFPKIANASNVFSDGDRYNSISGLIREGTCTSGTDDDWGTLWQAVQACIHVAALSAIALLAYRVKNAPKEFQESKYMGLIGMNVMSIGTVAGCIYFGMRKTLGPQYILFIQLMTTFMVTTLAALIMYLPKCRHIKKGDAKIELGQFGKSNKKAFMHTHSSTNSLPSMPSQLNLNSNPIRKGQAKQREHSNSWAKPPVIVEDGPHLESSNHV